MKISLRKCCISLLLFNMNNAKTKLFQSGIIKCKAEAEGLCTGVQNSNANLWGFLAHNSDEVYPRVASLDRCASTFFSMTYHTLFRV